MIVPFVDLKAQYNTIAKEVNSAIQRVLEKTDFILGEDVRLFEEEFAGYCGVKYAVGVDNGVSALELGLKALGIGPGDEVITADNTFIATASAISFTGAKPILVDIDPKTYNIAIEEIEAAITARSKAIIPVHLYGQPADMDAILEIARHYGLFVVEDACQAHGALYKGRRAGSMGDLAAFSFYPAKNLGAYGDGGMLVTNSEAIAAKVRMFRNYGQKEKYCHVSLTYNRRLDTVQAAILRVKLKYLDRWNEARRRHAALYNELLKDTDLIIPFEAEYATHVYHLFVIRVNDRDHLQTYLQSRGIATGIHYPIPIHLQDVYSSLGYKRGAFPVTEQFAGEILSLAMFPELTEEQVKTVASTIKQYR